MQQIDDQWTRSSTSQQGQTTTTHDCSGGFFVDNHVKVDWVVPDGSETHKSVNLLVRPKLTSERTPGQKRGGDILCRKELLANRRRPEEGEDQEEKLRNGSSREALMMLSLELASVPFCRPSVTFLLVRLNNSATHTHTHTKIGEKGKAPSQPSANQNFR
jgi:hypothetical protein